MKYINKAKLTSWNKRDNTHQLPYRVVKSVKSTRLMVRLKAATVLKSTLEGRAFHTLMIAYARWRRWT